MRTANCPRHRFSYCHPARAAAPARNERVRFLDETLAQEPSRLHRHADAFSDDRMRFARRVADDVCAVAAANAHTRTAP